MAHLRGILELAATYPAVALERAFALCHAYNTFSCHFIDGLLEQEPPSEMAPERLPSLRPLPVVAVRGDLPARPGKPYQELILAGGVSRE